MNTLLVPLDGSPLAEQALPHARALATLSGAQLHLMQVVPEQPSTLGLPEADYARSAETLRDRAAVYLDEQAQSVYSDSARVESKVYSGVPAEIIVDVAATMPDAWIVMATRGRSGIRRWALGSVTDKVLQAATVPVFVIRTPQPVFAAERATRRILLPLDGSARARIALPLARDLAQQVDAELIVFYTIAPDSGTYAGPYVLPMEHTRARQKQALQALEQTCAELRDSGVAATPLLTHGDVADQMCAAAAQHDVDLIIMTTHGYSGARRWALGSVADKVLRATTTPLLLVRAE